MTTISEHLDIGTPFGRIQVVHHILKILQVLVAYAPHVPSILMPLGGVRKEVGPLGNVLRSVTLFPGACIMSGARTYAAQVPTMHCCVLGGGSGSAVAYMAGVGHW